MTSKLYKKQILFCMAITLMASVVQAGDICNTVPECQKLKQLANTKIQQLEGNGTLSQLTGILKYADGKEELVLNQQQAEDLCRAQNKRLPTLKELAVDATRYGAKILELNQVSSNNVPEGFELIIAVNPSSTDKFYYSNKNYVAPHDVNHDLILSSSINPTINGYVFILNNSRGALYSVGDDSYQPGTYKGYLSSFIVRCMIPPA